MTLTLTQAAWLAVLAGVLVGTLVGARLSASLHDKDRQAIRVARLRLRGAAGFMLGVADSGRVDESLAGALRAEARLLYIAADDLTSHDPSREAQDRHPAGPDERIDDV